MSGSKFSLSREDASIVKGMLKRGDRQSDIAAFFGVNGGRIAEINTGQRWGDATTSPLESLPPAGPYLVGRSAIKARDTLVALRELIDECLRDIDFFEGFRD